MRSYPYHYRTPDFSELAGKTLKAARLEVVTAEATTNRETHPDVKEAGGVEPTQAGYYAWQKAESAFYAREREAGRV